MRNKKLFVKQYCAIFCSLFFSFSALGQTWIREYGDSSSILTYKIFEQYDKGYLFTGYKRLVIENAYGLLMKTDINGYELWSKCYGGVGSSSPLFGIDKTENEGHILIGQTTIGSSNWSALVIKTDACGEKEWCRIYHTRQRNVYGLDVKSLPGGGSIAMVGNWGNDWSKTLWLLNLDDNGDIVWQQTYGLDSLFYDPEGLQLFRTLDTTFIITGYVYSPDSGQTNPYILRPMIIKVKPDGNAVFELAWGTTMGFHGIGWATTDDSRTNLYSGTQSQLVSQSYVGPGLIKTSGAGQPLSYHNLVDTAITGGATTINWFSDSTIVMGLIWKEESSFGAPIITGVIKTDTLGNKIKFKQLIFDGDQAFKDGEITYNDKILLINSYYKSGSIKTFAFKLNSDLEYDSVYTRPFTYDSLCPHPILSDTIPLADCQMITVGLDDFLINSEKTELRIYPNPAQNLITVEIPKYLVRQTNGSGITATTVYHQWNSINLEIYDLNGRMVLSQEILKKTEKIELDVSFWNRGMYVARLVYIKEKVAETKFVLR
jgi:hypothetical protein